MIKIREMKISDVEQIHSLGTDEKRFRVGGSQKEFWTKEQLSNWVKANKDILLVAEDNKKIIGYTLTRHHIPTGKVDWENLQIDNEYSDQGIGNMLTEEMLKKLKKLKVKYVCSLAEEDNIAITKIFEKNGFKKGKKMVWWDQLT